MPPEAIVRTLIVAEPFDGYPDGSREGARRVSYVAGQEIQVDDAFADLVTGKGLATERPAPAQRAPDLPAAEEEDQPA